MLPIKVYEWSLASREPTGRFTSAERHSQSETEKIASERNCSVICFVFSDKNITYLIILSFSFTTTLNFSTQNLTDVHTMTQGSQKINSP